MGFQSGSVSFRRIAVIGERQDAEILLHAISEHAFKPTELGIPEEIEYGWSGARNVLDADFSFESCVFADCVFFGLRIDTNKVPGSLKRAYTEQEEKIVAAGNPSGFISKAQKKDVKDTVRQKCEDEMRSGQHRRSKVIPLLWDLTAGTLYAAVQGQAFSMLAELFERSFGLSLVPLSAGALAERHYTDSRRNYEDLRPTRFTPGPEGEGQYPEYPWVVRGPQPKDFLGNEFLVWLWFMSEKVDNIGIGNRTIWAFVDRQLDMDCAYGQTGSDAIRGDGPGKSKEAREALKSGKVPRKMRLLLNSNKQDFSFTVSAESLAIASAKLPDIENAETPRTLFEERISLIRDLNILIDQLFKTFLESRTTTWQGCLRDIQKWIGK